MSEHLPNRDMLGAYIDDGLSFEAARSMEQHLRICPVCVDALDEERKLLTALDGIAGIEPPPDFVEAVMGRVAQHPAYRPSTPVPWRLAAQWGFALVALLVVVLGVGAWSVLQAGVVTEGAPSGALVYAISRLTDFATYALHFARQTVAPVYALVETLGKIVLRMAGMATGSSWLVQATFWLLTIMLNYAFMRMVLGYQRRH